MSGAFFAHLLAYLYISGMEFHHSIKPIVVIITYSYRHHRKSVRHLEYDNLSWYVSQSVSDIFNRSAVLVELDPMDGPHQASSLQSMRVAYSDHSSNPVCGFGCYTISHLPHRVTKVLGDTDYVDIKMRVVYSI